MSEQPKWPDSVWVVRGVSRASNVGSGISGHPCYENKSDADVDVRVWHNAETDKYVHAQHADDLATALRNVRTSIRTGEDRSKAYELIYDALTKYEETGR